MSFIRRLSPTCTESTVGSSGAIVKFEFWSNGHDHYSCWLVRRSKNHASDCLVLKRKFQPEKQALWRMIRRLVWRAIYIASDYPSMKDVSNPGKTGSLKDNPTISSTLHFFRRIIQLLWSDSPTTGAPDYPSTLRFSCFSFLTWIWFDLRFFLLSSDFLSFIAGLELILSKCAWNLRPTQGKVKLLTSEPLFIVRSWTKNYKTYTKSSVLHLLVTLESRKVLSLDNLSPRLWMLILMGLLSFVTLTVKQ